MGRERVGLDHVAHHQEADRIHAKVARSGDMLAGDIGFGAVGRDPHGRHAQPVSGPQILDGAYAGNEQSGQSRMLDDVGHGFDPFPIGVRTEPIVEARAVEAVAMRDLDRVDAGLVQRLGDAA